MKSPALFSPWAGAQLTIPNVRAKPASTMRMLGVATPLVWAQQGEHLIVQMPAVQPGRHAFPIAIQTE
jgi:hypothetical protein